jgi:flagellar hook-associated protein 2
MIMSISASGLISGLDTNSIISQLLALQQRPILQLQRREAGYQVELTAYGNLKGVLNSLKSAAEGLDSISDLTSFSASSGDTDIFTASAGSSATAGSYSITVEQLTLAHKVKSTAFTETEEVLEFKVTLDTNDNIDFKEDGGGELTATITAGTYTVSELEAEIKNQLETASDGGGNNIDYTVSYDSSTKKFTIKEDGSDLEQLDILWATGTNNDKSASSLLGFAAENDTGLLEYTSDNEVGEGTIHLEIGNVFTIGENNKYIDFEEENVARLATLTEGNYTVSELEEHIEEEMEKEGDGTYNVSYDNSTQKFTITASIDVTDLDLLWKTGAHGSENAGNSAASLLGFNAENDEGGTGHTGDNEVGVVTDISISATDTIEDVADAINDADAGVIAAVIFDGTDYILSLTAEDSGKANVINLMVTDIDGDNTDSVGLSRLVYHEGGTTKLTETQDAKDSIIHVDGVKVYRATNTIDDVIEGVTITLKDIHTGWEEEPPESDTLTVSRNTSAVVSKVNSFVSAYNTVLGFFETYQQYDQETKITGILFGDTTTTMIRRGLRDRVGDMVPGVGSFNRLADLGVTLNDEGELEVDSSTLNDALDDHFDDVLKFFTQSTGGSEGFAVRMVDSLESFLNSVDGTLPAREEGIRSTIDDIQENVERLEARIEASEILMRAQFNALEVLLGQYQTTSDFLSQQLTGLRNLNSYISSR